jgi:hypothetical protein
VVWVVKTRQVYGLGLSKARSGRAEPSRKLWVDEEKWWRRLSVEITILQRISKALPQK